MRRILLATLGPALLALLAPPTGAQVSEETLQSITTPDKVEIEHRHAGIQGRRTEQRDRQPRPTTTST